MWSTSTVNVDDTALFLVDVDQTALFQSVDGQPLSTLADMSTSVVVHFTAFFITPTNTSVCTIFDLSWLLWLKTSSPCIVDDAMRWKEEIETKLDSY